MKYTTDEALSEIIQRSKRVEIKKERRACQIQSGIVGLTSLSLLMVIAFLQGNSTITTPGSVYGSFLLSREAGGYVLAALIAFVLGIVVTILCLRRKKNKNDSDKEIDIKFTE